MKTYTVTHQDGSQMTLNITADGFARTFKLLAECGYVKIEEVK